MSRAEVRVAGKKCGEIAQGYLIFVGFGKNDDAEVSAKMAKKIKNLRIFSDEKGLMNRSITEVEGRILSVPQFTLYADTKSGNRPSFTQSAPAQTAKILYEAFNEQLRAEGLTVETGIFQADMAVETINEGPVTIIIDSEEGR